MKFLFLPLLFLIPAAALSAPSMEPDSEKLQRAKAVLEKWHAQDPAEAGKKLHVVYWTPSDREPLAGHRIRISAILEDVRRFYGKEMIRLGFGATTFPLDYEKDGKARIHVVKGTKTFSASVGASAAEIREECFPVLKAAGVDPEKETVLICCNLAEWNAAEKSIRQPASFPAAGSNLGGTAWMIDSPILGLPFLAKAEPVIRDERHGEISVGKYNSILIGGLAHEIGHALGLPHERSSSSTETSLMTDGSGTYGALLRNEGNGPSLTLTQGLRLASHPLFTNRAKGLDSQAIPELSEVSLTSQGDTFTWSAKIAADPPVYAVIGYVDPDGNSDQDAEAVFAVPDEAGDVTLMAKTPPPGKSGVWRIVLLQVQGSAGPYGEPASSYSFPYHVTADGKADLSVGQAMLRLEPLLHKVATRQTLAARDEMRAIEESKPGQDVIEAARAIASTLGFRPGQPPVNSTAKTLHLSEAAMSESRVGVGSAVPNRLPGDRDVLACGTRLFARGLYAHAPSLHSWDLAGKWSRLTGHAGIPTGHGGICVFVIKGDGKELWRSEKIGSGKLISFDLPLAGVNVLELVVEDAGDGNDGDWGCWFEPVITR